MISRSPRFPIALALWAGLAALPGVAQAQAPAGESADAIVQAALLQLQRIDQGSTGDVYRAAPDFVRQRLDPQDFANSVARERVRLGRVSQRQWLSVERAFVAMAAGAPPTLCANAVFNSATAPQARERVSLCWVNGEWRPTGYTTTVPTAAAPGPAASAPR